MVMTYYFIVVTWGSSISMMVYHIIMADPVQLARWQFETPEVSQSAFHGSTFVIVDWIFAYVNNFNIAKLADLCTTIDPVIFVSDMFPYSGFYSTTSAINNAFTMGDCKIFPIKWGLPVK